MTESTYQVGDRVRKVGGDYTLAGTVVSVFEKKSGTIRYVVEADEPTGLLMIYGAANLTREPPMYAPGVKR